MKLTGFLVIVVGAAFIYLAYTGKLTRVGTLLQQIATQKLVR